MIHVNSLPKKFHPFLLGHSECKAPYKAEIDKVFTQPLNSIKEHIFDAGDWILKRNRKDIPMREDTLIYRVRKANKIRNYIQTNKLEGDIVVPEKYLYWNDTEQKIYVVSKKIITSNEVAKPFNSSIEEQIKRLGLQAHGQAEALSQGAPKRAITAVQAKTLTNLCYQTGYTDLTYNNFYFSPEGKVVILDTEPVDRTAKKSFFPNSGWKKYVFNILFDKTNCYAGLAEMGVFKLKHMCSDPKALKEVEQVEIKYALLNTAKLTAKLALTILALHAMAWGVAAGYLGSVVITHGAKAILLWKRTICIVSIVLRGVNLGLSRWRFSVSKM